LLSGAAPKARTEYGAIHNTLGIGLYPIEQNLKNKRINHRKAISGISRILLSVKK